jgi:hypothetical protein
VSKIFEALQVAQTERKQLNKLARKVSIEPKDTTQVVKPALVPPAAIPEVRTETAESTACNCEQRSHRIRRQGIWDFLLGLFGLYPWKCSQCKRHFHRSRRY